MQDFHGTGGTWTAPLNLRNGQVFITALAGGGAGGGASATYTGSGGGGGSGGWVKRRRIAVVPGTTYVVSIGQGGTGVAGADGNPGGSTSFGGTLLTMSGGSGGKVGGFGGAGGSPGGSAGYPDETPTTPFMWGRGAPSIFGDGGLGAMINPAGTGGKNGHNAGWGGGGGGGFYWTSGSWKGGNGGDGLMLIEWLD